MSKTIFSVLFFLLLQTCGIIFKTCNAGNSEKYNQCITELREEVNSRTGETINKYRCISDVRGLLDIVLERRDKLNENEFAEQIIDYMVSHKARIYALIENHKFYFKFFGARSESKIKDKDGKRKLFDRGIKADTWKIHVDFRTLNENQFNPESTSENRHTHYFSKDVTVLLYVLSSLKASFFGEKPKNIKIRKIDEEDSTAKFFQKAPEERGCFYRETIYGRNLKRLEYEIGLVVENKYRISQDGRSEQFSLSFDVLKNLSPEVEDNKDSIFRRFFSHFWR